MYHFIRLLRRYGQLFNPFNLATCLKSQTLVEEWEMIPFDMAFDDYLHIDEDEEGKHPSTKSSKYFVVRIKPDTPEV